jgi:hypothetical protein
LQAKDKLAAAESLTDKLGGEKVRWEQQIGGLEGQLKKLPLVALLAASFMTYLPGQPEDFRRRMLSKWQVRVASFRAGARFFGLCSKVKLADGHRFYELGIARGFPATRSCEGQIKVAVDLLAEYLPATQACKWQRRVPVCF